MNQTEKKQTNEMIARVKEQYPEADKINIGQIYIPQASEGMTPGWQQTTRPGLTVPTLVNYVYRLGATNVNLEIITSRDSFEIRFPDYKIHDLLGVDIVIVLERDRVKFLGKTGEHELTNTEDSRWKWTYRVMNHLKGFASRNCDENNRSKVALVVNGKIEFEAFRPDNIGGVNYIVEIITRGIDVTQKGSSWYENINQADRCVDVVQVTGAPSSKFRIEWEMPNMGTQGGWRSGIRIGGSVYYLPEHGWMRRKWIG